MNIKDMKLDDKIQLLNRYAVDGYEILRQKEHQKVEELGSDIIMQDAWMVNIKSQWKMFIQGMESVPIIQKENIIDFLLTKKEEVLDYLYSETLYCDMTFSEDWDEMANMLEEFYEDEIISGRIE